MLHALPAAGTWGGVNIPLTAWSHGACLVLMDVFDPLHAEKSIEIGTFYFKKGNYEAALDRFMDATRFQPALAMPWKLIGETYEKMHDDSRAAESYRKYLQIFPGAQDAAKVKKRIAALDAKAGHPASKHLVQ